MLLKRCFYSMTYHSGNGPLVCRITSKMMHVRVSTRGSVRASFVALVRSQCVCEARRIRTMCPCAHVRTSVRVCAHVLARTHVRVWVSFFSWAASSRAQRVLFAKSHQALRPHKIGSVRALAEPGHLQSADMSHSARPSSIRTEGALSGL